MTTAAAYPDSHAALRWRRWLLLAGRVVLGGIFGYAAYVKLKQPWMLFAMSVDSFQILPAWGVTFVARTLPWMELILALLLLLGWKLRWTACAVTALLAVFFGVLVHAYMKGLTIDCGCFGPGERLGPLKLVEDGSMLAVSLAVTIGAFLSSHHGTRRGGEIGAAAQGFSAVR
jgi:uncharacterized membrane protein YphA (DoxX/SURF4 family)